MAVARAAAPSRRAPTVPMLQAPSSDEAGGPPEDVVPGGVVDAGGVPAPMGGAGSHAEVAALHVAPGMQAGRPPRGVPDTGVHVPGVALQLSHWPPQALSQHTPSVQKLLWHSAATLQALPFATKHLFSLQPAPATHAASEVHDVGQP